MTAQPSAKMVTEAAGWAALLDGEDASADERAACRDWCERDPLHRLALDRMRGIEAQLDGLDAAQRQALKMATARRGRRAAKAAGTALGAVAVMTAAWFAAGTGLVQQYFPDHATAIGEQRTVALSDGSTLTLDSDSALDVQMTSGRRTVTLFRGRVLATVARDAARPFSVETGDGTATALGTAFVVEREPRGMQVTVTHSRVELCVPGRVTCAQLAEGERARIADGALQRLAAVDAGGAAAWSRGWLEADDLPLVAVLQELNRYRSAPIRFDAASLAAIRVTGAYPLADTDRALEAMAETAGLKAVREADGGWNVSRR